jgi:hypothetical protein
MPRFNHRCPYGICGGQVGSWKSPPSLSQTFGFTLLVSLRQCSINMYSAPQTNKTTANDANKRHSDDGTRNLCFKNLHIGNLHINQRFYIYVYIYIYVCVCVCVLCIQSQNRIGRNGAESLGSRQRLLAGSYIHGSEISWLGEQLSVSQE